MLLRRVLWFSPVCASLRVGVAAHVVCGGACAAPVHLGALRTTGADRLQAAHLQERSLLRQALTTQVRRPPPRTTGPPPIDRGPLALPLPPLPPHPHHPHHPPTPTLPIPNDHDRSRHPALSHPTLTGPRRSQPSPRPPPSPPPHAHHHPYLHPKPRPHPHPHPPPQVHCHLKVRE